MKERINVRGVLWVENEAIKRCCVELGVTYIIVVVSMPAVCACVVTFMKWRGGVVMLVSADCIREGPRVGLVV